MKVDTQDSKLNTPMMRQYQSIKCDHDDAILFFRLGDFYEMFLEDAKIASKELELTLTGRGKDDNRIPMCGIPYHAAEKYIPKLVSRGYKVAICEQVEDASESQGITKREVVQIITPGTLTGEGQLDETENNFLAAIQPLKNEGFGCSYVDISTGEFRCALVENASQLNALLDRIDAKEVLIPHDTTLPFETKGLINKEHFQSIDSAESELKRHFKVSSLSSFGLDEVKEAFPAAWVVLDYVKHTKKNALPQLIKLSPVHTHDSLFMDPVTLKNLELTDSLHQKGRQGTLFWVLNYTKTAMGARKLKQAIKAPLLSRSRIEMRLDAVASLKEDLLSREEIRESLKQVYDLERLITRIASDHHNPRDCIALKNSLAACKDLADILPHLSGKILERHATFFTNFNQDNSPFKQVIEEIEAAIVDTPPVSIKDGQVIKDGYNEELDALKLSFKSIKDWIVGLEPSEREKTGIKSLKVGFNKVFGYYLEVPNSQKDRVPAHYIRKQTLTNAERYITPELKEKENILLHGEEKQSQLEITLYKTLVTFINGFVKDLQYCAAIIADLDFLQSLATSSQKHNYVRPQFCEDDEGRFKIKEGRHPVLEKTPDHDFISNSVSLSNDSHNFALITGPNMAGKSTLMRQIALIVVMAQLGCFIPAQSGTLSIVDKLFTRIGALDNLYLGQSTYMVEMVETATILNTATKNSLIILDEIGRGTATYDGMSIAWAITEHIHNQIGARTLFATHYHELTILEKSLAKLKNFNMKITENKDSIVFNYKFIEGPADKSYGVHVAKMAGLPHSVIEKAHVLLDRFEDEGLGYLKDKANPDLQMSLF